MAGIVPGPPVKLYERDGQTFAHPDDPEVCLMYHAYGEQCPCEYWALVGIALLPVGWSAERVPMLTETGFMLTYRGKYYEILSME